MQLRSCRLYLTPLVLALALSGCATVTNYTYKSSAPKSVAGKSAGVNVLPAVDRRDLPEPGVQGYVIDTMGGRYDTFRDPNNFMQVISDGLAEELKNNGYQITGDSKDLAVAMDVLETNCNVNPVNGIYKLRYTMKVRIQVTDRGEPAFEQTYSSEYADTYNILNGPGVQYQKGMSDIFGQAIADLNEYLKT